MEPQITQNAQTDTCEGAVNVLSKRIIGCALTVLHALGVGALRKSMKAHWCTNSTSLGPPSRNNIPWPFGTMGSWSGNILLTYSSSTSFSSN
jgi:hypothetical protein